MDIVAILLKMIGMKRINKNNTEMKEVEEVKVKKTRKTKKVKEMKVTKEFLIKLVEELPLYASQSNSDYCENYFVINKHFNNIEKFMVCVYAHKTDRWYFSVYTFTDERKEFIFSTESEENTADLFDIMRKNHERNETRIVELLS